MRFEKMIRAAALGVLAAGCLMGGNAAPASAQSNVCGTYAIGGCFKSLAAAQNHSARIDATFVVDTNTVPSFTNGWYCVTRDPTTPNNAAFDKREFIAAGVKDAYIKEGCK